MISEFNFTRSHEAEITRQISLLNPHGASEEPGFINHCAHCDS